MSDRVKKNRKLHSDAAARNALSRQTAAGEEPNGRGYLVRKANRTVYPTFDRSVLVRIETENGAVGWGETYGLVAPRATMEIIDDLLADSRLAATLRCGGDP